MMRTSLEVSFFRPALSTAELLRFAADSARGAMNHGLDRTRFERAFADAVAAPEAVAISSVRFGLYEVLRALQLPPGAGVLCSPLNVFPVIDAIRAAGARPVLVDLEPDSFGLDLADAARKLDSARVLLATHLWGTPHDLPVVEAFAARHGLVLLEDASQCLDGRFNGSEVGSFGLVTFYSLGLTNLVSAVCGAVASGHDPTLMDALRAASATLPPPRRGRMVGSAFEAMSLRMLTAASVYPHLGSTVVGQLRRLQEGARTWTQRRSPPPPVGRALECVRVAFGEPQARAALHSLEALPAQQARRLEIIARYRAELAGLPGLRLPNPHPAVTPSPWSFVVFHPRAGALQAHLRRQGIDAVPSSVDPCHDLPHLPELRTPLPEATRLQRECTRLPVHAAMGDREVTHVIASIADFCRREV